MTRPITLFTCQWVNLPFPRVRELAAEWGYDGLADHGLGVFALSHLVVGQAVCDHPIDERHQAILPLRIGGDGDPEGVRQRATAEMADTARAAAALGVDTFTGSPIWYAVAMCPAVPESMVEAGYPPCGWATGGPAASARTCPAAARVAVGSSSPPATARRQAHPAGASHDRRARLTHPLAPRDANGRPTQSSHDRGVRRC